MRSCHRTTGPNRTESIRFTSNYWNSKRQLRMELAAHYTVANANRKVACCVVYIEVVICKQFLQDLPRRDALSSRSPCASALSQVSIPSNVTIRCQSQNIQRLPIHPVSKIIKPNAHKDLRYSSPRREEKILSLARLPRS